MATIDKLICNLKDEVSKWFYQKGDVDSRLEDKSDVGHVHDDRYYTESEMDTKLNAKANTNHTHKNLATTTLGSNVDFNDYKTEGIYVIGWANAQSATNIPNKTGGRLEVISVQTGVKQIYHNHGASGSGLRIWWRNYYPDTDTWFDWQQVITTNYVDTALSSTSTNPVQNKVVKAELDSLNNNKANSNHTHNDYTATTTVPCEYGTVRKFKKNGWVMVIWENIDISSIPKDTWTVLADIGWSNQAGNNYTGNFHTQNPSNNRFRVTVEGQLRAWRQTDSNNTGYYGYIVYPTTD